MRKLLLSLALLAVLPLWAEDNPSEIPCGARCSRSYSRIAAISRAVSTKLALFMYTVVSASAQGEMTAFPATESRPNTSAISYRASIARANNGILKLGNGALAFYCNQLGGSAHLIIDVNGYFMEGGATVVAYHAYYPFGQEVTSSTQDAEIRKFTSHERDVANPASVADDLDYMHARHYSMVTGRFLSFDPIGGSARSPQSWNRYAYTLGNPLKYIDPEGLSFFGVVADPPPVGDVVPDYYYMEGVFASTNAFRGTTTNPNTGLWGAGNLAAGGMFFRSLSSLGSPALSLSDRLLSSINADFAQTIGEFSVGFGDIVSFGLTELYRNEAGLANTVNEDSAAYTAGEVAGIAHGIALGSAGVARAAGMQTKIAIHGAHHTFGRLGRLRHFQLNWWRIGVKGSGGSFRIPFPWK